MIMWAGSFRFLSFFIAFLSFIQTLLLCGGKLRYYFHTHLDFFLKLFLLFFLSYSSFTYYSIFRILPAFRPHM
ncbi:hypothetical protein CC80DRAFT_142202 [Byssothecium circinans]|uniref:Uncharacterized protein n=1 Tax=Byssothecium circinans TaxID=147558 RepID=A0A6A5TNS2_9PLEO|nr:hypothetical protein CC80DRAFT_142202 [Byssothecium circinans]